MGPMLGDVLPRRPEARRLLAATLFSATGRGLTLPFMFTYLTKVRDVPTTTAACCWSRPAARPSRDRRPGDTATPTWLSGGVRPPGFRRLLAFGVVRKVR